MLKITLLITTRERAHVLDKCLETCVGQDWSDCELLISDNVSKDHTKQVIDEFRFKLPIRDINPGRRLGMSEHWEFAIPQAKGEYLLLIGDDDGLPSGALAALKTLLAEYEGVDGIVWPQHCFCYPSLPDLSKRGNFYHQGGDILQLRKGSASAALYFSGLIGYTDLPGVYHKLSKTSLVQEVVANGIQSIAPDIGIATALAEKTDTFLYSRTAFTIPGASPSSNGFSALVPDSDKQQAVNFLRETSIGTTPPFDIVSISLESNWHLMQLESIVRVQRARDSKNPIAVDYLEHLRQIKIEAESLPLKTRISLDESLWILYQELAKEFSFPALTKEGFLEKVAQKTKSSARWGSGEAIRCAVGNEYPDIAAAMPALEQAIKNAASQMPGLLKRVLPEITENLQKKSFRKLLLRIYEIEKELGADLLHMVVSPAVLAKFLENYFEKDQASKYAFSLTFSYYIIFKYIDLNVDYSNIIENVLKQIYELNFEENTSHLNQIDWRKPRFIYRKAGRKMLLLEKFGLLWAASIALKAKNLLKSNFSYVL